MSQCSFPTFEKELRDQLENMNRVMKSKERKQLQAFRDHKVLQTRFTRQEGLLHAMQQENKALLMRIRQYEHCLDDVMRKVVDAIVAEDNLREEVAMLKNRVRDLEAQNAALSSSPAKGRDEGYCTMSIGQPQPSYGQLENLPEEPEQWLLHTEPCSTEMEDWSMSQDELAVITVDGNPEHNWIWNSNDFLSSTMAEHDSSADNIAKLLQQKIVYSEDEEIACTNFTDDFYKLVNIHSNSAKSLFSYLEGNTDDDDDDEEDEDVNDGVSSLSLTTADLRCQSSTSEQLLTSPTPSAAGRAQLTSCSSTDSSELSHCVTHKETLQDQAEGTADTAEVATASSDIRNNSEELIPDSEQKNLLKSPCHQPDTKSGIRKLPPILRKSKSLVQDEEVCCTRYTQQRQKVGSIMVRSESENCAVTENPVSLNKTPRPKENSPKRPLNSWRKSTGWKRVTGTPPQSATSQESIKRTIKSCQPRATKVQPTKIPTCLGTQQSQLLHAAKPLPGKKSKIPPPVPVRRSYAS